MRLSSSKSTSRHLAHLFALTCLCLGLGANAQSSKGTEAPDRQFLSQAADGNLAEVTLGQLALEKSASEAIKRFGQRMVDDHGKSYTELSVLAAKEGVDIPREPSAAKHAEAKKMAGLKGAEFDRQFAEHMVEAHQKTIALYKDAAQNARSSSVKAYAQKTVPTLEEHLRLARTLRDAKS